MKSRLVCHAVRSFLTGFLLLIGFLCLPAAYAGDGVTTWDPPAQDGTQQDPYQISTMEHLKWMEEQINTFRNPFPGKYFELRSDFDLDSKPWNPLGFSNEYFFNGHFDGKDHTISNLYIHVEGSNGKMLGVGFFGVTGKDAVIQNLNFNNISIVAKKERSGFLYVGGIVGCNEGTIKNCTVALGIGATISATSTYDSDSFSGGICGQNYAIISGCTVTLGENATISAKSSFESYSYSGGICGQNGDYVSTNRTISGCTVTLGENATISADNSSGGICGWNGTTISECTVTLETGATISSQNISGGICGSSQKNITISHCMVTMRECATISSRNTSGEPSGGFIMK